jgi:hypothetical protein
MILESKFPIPAEMTLYMKKILKIKFLKLVSFTVLQNSPWSDRMLQFLNE